MALVILATAVAGLFATFIASQKYVSRSRHRLAAANAARMVLEDLKAYVDQKTWDDATVNLLVCPPPGYPCTRTYTLPAADYPPAPSPWNWSANYTISLVPVGAGGIQMRRVDVTIHWDEPQ